MTIPHCGGPHWRRFFSTVFVFFVATLLPAGCSKQAHDEILADLPPKLARDIASSDDNTLAHYVHDIGYEDLRDALNMLTVREYKLWIAGREGDARRARIYARRLAAIFAAERHDTLFLSDIEFRERLPRETYGALARARRDIGLLDTNTPSQPQACIDAYTALATRFRQLGDPGCETMCLWQIAEATRSLGDEAGYDSALRAACRGFESVGNHFMTCQALGVLGAEYEWAGKIDSMVICYEEALRIANRSRIGDQAARILTFYAGHYGRQGRLELQRLQLLRAMDVARDYNSGYRELRYIYEAMRFHADLGCWGVVDDLLTQAHGVKRRGKGKSLRLREMFFLRTDVTEARLRMARGDVTGAERIMDRVLDRMAELNLPGSYRAEDEAISVYRAEGLLKNDRAEAALEVTREALARPPEESAHDWLARLALLMAQASLQLGDIDTAEVALGKFDHFSMGYERSLRRELTERDALRGRTALALGHSHEALRALVAGLVHLEHTAARIDASVGSYLWLARCDDLRQLMHELVANDPLAGYGADLFWRGLYETLGGEERDATPRGLKPPDSVATDRDEVLSTADFIRGIRARGQSALDQVSALDAVHCVYFLCGDTICRWTASRRGLRKDALPVPASDLRGLVARAVKMMSDHPHDRDAAPSDDLRLALRDLGRTLLPAEIFKAAERSEDQPFSFYVSTDGFLGQIPFGAFDIGKGDAYEPLLARCDVAYLRSVCELPAERALGRGVVVANSGAVTTPHKRFVTRPVLRHVSAETRALRDLDSDAIILAGDMATKRRLTSLWETAPYIYMATHTVWDPELPYLTMIPLVVPEGEPAPDAGFLDIADIRASKLGRCEIVVLSGCSSGAPYIEQHTMGPSLGDAFLDAGAASVVHTFWDVKDEDAKRIGIGFVEGWEKEGASKVRALSEARRAEMRGPNGVRHPSCWASYAIKLSRF